MLFYRCMYVWADVYGLDVIYKFMLMSDFVNQPCSIVCIYIVGHKEILLIDVYIFITWLYSCLLIYILTCLIKTPHCILIYNYILGCNYLSGLILNVTICPQAIFYRRYSVQSDIWSYGCVVYEIWSLGHKPFEDDDGREVQLR